MELNKIIIAGVYLFNIFPFFLFGFASSSFSPCGRGRFWCLKTNKLQRLQEVELRCFQSDLSYQQVLSVTGGPDGC